MYAVDFPTKIFLRGESWGSIICMPYKSCSKALKLSINLNDVACKLKLKEQIKNRDLFKKKKES
jgi:hypothetical protein